MEDINFRKTHLYVLYNKKYKMIERRASSLIIENQTLRELGKVENEPKFINNFDLPYHQDKTYENTFVNLN